MRSLDTVDRLEKHWIHGTGTAQSSRQATQGMVALFGSNVTIGHECTSGIMETRQTKTTCFRRGRKLSVIRLEGEAIAGSFNGTQGSRRLKRRHLIHQWLQNRAVSMARDDAEKRSRGIQNRLILVLMLTSTDMRCRLPNNSSKRNHF
jgi:hypothetical protein